MDNVSEGSRKGHGIFEVEHREAILAWLDGPAIEMRQCSVGIKGVKHFLSSKW